MPTRSFYAWLFKSIKLEDTLCANVPGFEGNFFPVANDCVMMWAMLEMAHRRFKYMKKTSYIANRGNPVNGGKVDGTLYDQVRSEIRYKKPLYPSLAFSDIDRLLPFEQAKADCLFLFENNYDDLVCTIGTIQTYAKNLDNIIVLYPEGKLVTDMILQELKEKFPGIRFIKIDKKDGYTATVNALKALPNDHVFLANDRCKLTEPLDCTYCIYELERTFAYGFYISVSPSLCRRNRVPCQYIVDDLYAWKFACDERKKLNIHNFDMTLYRTEDFTKSLEKKQFWSLVELEKNWRKTPVDRKKVGLF